MRELLPQLKQLLADQRPTAYCRLVETRGSTPQKAGATMLVYADGSQAGTLGGGNPLSAIQTGGETKIAKQSAKADAAEAKAAKARICPTRWITRGA